MVPLFYAESGWLRICSAYGDIHGPQPWDKSVELPPRLSQEQIVAMTDSTQPTVNELLQELQRGGVVDVSRKNIILPNPLTYSPESKVKGKIKRDSALQEPPGAFTPDFYPPILDITPCTE